MTKIDIATLCFLIVAVLSAWIIFYSRFDVKKKNTVKTNGDLIRNMGNAELAVTIVCPNETGMAEIECDHSDSKDCCRCCFDWLNQPIER